MELLQIHIVNTEQYRNKYRKHYFIWHFDLAMCHLQEKSKTHQGNRKEKVRCEGNGAILCNLMNIGMCQITGTE